MKEDRINIKKIIKSKSLNILLKNERYLYRYDGMLVVEIIFNNISKTTRVNNYGYFKIWVKKLFKLYGIESLISIIHARKLENKKFKYYLELMR